MFGMLGSVSGLTPVVVAQLFPDIGGFFLGQEFLGTLAGLVATLLSNLLLGVLGPIFGFTI